MKRRLQWFCSCALLCALLVTAALPAPAAAASTGFSDVPESHWAADSIRRAVDLGLFQGQTPTRFGLGAPMTRGAFVVALCRLFGWEMVTPEAGSYTDNQDKSAWYYSAVETAYANGAITRQTDTFRPREPITREELAVMLVRAMGYGTIAGLAQDLPMPFRDVTTNVGYIAMAHELGLVNGTAATTFSPDQTATREQAAVMLIRLYDSYHAAAPEKTGIAYSAEGLTDLTGYGAVAVGGARLIYAGESRLAGTPDAETAAALQETITAAGAVPLLHVGGSASALKDDPSHTAEVLAAAVESGGYEGLFLDLAELSSAQKKDFTALAEALRAELGEDRLLYLMVEAPVWQGAAYNGYDYAALSEPADKLVVRVTDYGDVSEDFPIAPPGAAGGGLLRPGRTGGPGGFRLSQPAADHHGLRLDGWAAHRPGLRRRDRAAAVRLPDERLLLRPLRLRLSHLRQRGHRGVVSQRRGRPGAGPDGCFLRRGPAVPQRPVLCGGL